MATSQENIKPTLESTRSQLIVPTDKKWYIEWGEQSTGWQRQEYDECDRNADVFVAIYNNNFEKFKELFEITPGYIENSSLYEDAEMRKKEELRMFFKSVITNDLRSSKIINIVSTMKKLGLWFDGVIATPQHYILIRLEKIFSTYNSTEQEKTNIKALWNMLTLSFSITLGDIKDDIKDHIKYDRFINHETFQNFLRKIMGNYKPIDDVIGKEEKDAFVNTYIIYTVGEKAQQVKQGISNKFSSAKQGISDKFSSFNPFRKKTEAAPVTTDAAPAPTDAAPAPAPAPAPTGEAPVTTDAASVPVTSAPTGEAPAKKGFLSGISNPFGKKDTTEKKGWFSGGRKSRKQGKSKKQRKSRKQRKTRK